MVKPVRKAGVTVYTAGHSTRTLEDFLRLLRAYGIKRLIDIRTIPRSRHNPQFNRETLSRFLRNHRINYRHMKSLGGLRHAVKDSVNSGWRNASFKGFADYMQTPEFEEALLRLIDLAREKASAIMCAEAVPWRCHRSLIGDALVLHGVNVLDIYSMTGVKAHLLSPMARARGNKLTYPAV